MTRGTEVLESFLLASENLEVEFQNVHFQPLRKGPAQADEADIVELKGDLADLEEVMSRLEERCNSAPRRRLDTCTTPTPPRI